MLNPKPYPSQLPKPRRVHCANRDAIWPPRRKRRRGPAPRNHRRPGEAFARRVCDNGAWHARTPMPWDRAPAAWPVLQPAAAIAGDADQCPARRRCEHGRLFLNSRIHDRALRIGARSLRIGARLCITRRCRVVHYASVQGRALRVGARSRLAHWCMRPAARRAATGGAGLNPRMVDGGYGPRHDVAVERVRDTQRAQSVVPLLSANEHPGDEPSKTPRRRCCKNNTQGQRRVRPGVRLIPAHLQSAALGGWPLCVTRLVLVHSERGTPRN